MVAWVPLIYAGLQLTSAVGSTRADKKQQKAVEEYQSKQRAAAWENYRYQTRALQNRLAEEKEASSYEQQQIMIQNMQAKAAAQASSASNGIQGSTIDNLYKDYDRANAASEYIAKRNLYLKGLQTNDNMEAARIEALNVINGMQTYQSNTTSTLLSGIGNAFSAYGQAYLSEAQTKFYTGRGQNI